jgi:hypothetical protein
MSRYPAGVLAHIAMFAIQVIRFQKCEKCKTGQKCDKDDHPDIESDKPPYRRGGDMCFYHEHESEEERELCMHKWKHLRKARGFEI